MTNKKILFSVVTVLFWFSLYAYVPQLTNYANEMGASYRLIGLIGGAYGFTQTILRIPIGIISDKLMKRKVFVLLGIICAVISAASVYFLPNPYTLLIARLIAGIASATWVNFTILFLSYYDSSESSKAIAIINTNNRIGQLFSMLLGGFVAIRFGVKQVFLLSTIIAAISLFLGAFIYESKEKSRINIKSNNKDFGFMDVVKNKKVVRISILAAVIQMMVYSTNFGFTPIIARKLGADDLQLSFLTTIFTLPQVLFSLLSVTIFTKKFGEVLTLKIGFLISAIVCILTPFTTKLYILYIMQLISGIGNIIVFTLTMSMVIKGVETNLMTTTMGFYQAVFGLGMILGPILLGNIGDIFGLTAGFIVVGILGLVSVWYTNKLSI